MKGYTQLRFVDTSFTALVYSSRDKVTQWSHMQDPNERKQAEESLTPFGKSTDYIPHLRVCCRIQSGSCRLGVL